MDLVVASAELREGNVLSFNAFPTYPYSLLFVITFHVEGEISGKIAYRARKREEVIYQTEPASFHVPAMEGRKMFTHADSVGLVFPSQGSYFLDVVFDESVLHSLPFSVFDSRQRSDLEKEILYYLKRQRKDRTVQEITRGIYNPKLLNKANMGEISGKVYFALLRMKEVTNLTPVDQGTLQEKMHASRWRLK